MMTVIEPVLFVDEQSLPPGAFCETCRGELYPPTFTCLRCERRKP